MIVLQPESSGTEVSWVYMIIREWKGSEEIGVKFPFVEFVLMSLGESIMRRNRVPKCFLVKNLALKVFWTS
ncbi:hypothetical protein HanIR_Chr09g0391991 [Helianthus annuus]|nr:hypothetical protein HanIR_Chr09g0391991 [Helianthus annuus]